MNEEAYCIGGAGPPLRFVTSEISRTTGKKEPETKLIVCNTEHNIRTVCVYMSKYVCIYVCMCVCEFSGEPVLKKLEYTEEHLDSDMSDKFVLFSLPVHTSPV